MMSVSTKVDRGERGCMGCILDVIQNWTVARPRKEAKLAKVFRQLKCSDFDTAFQKHEILSVSYKIPRITQLVHSVQYVVPITAVDT